MLTSAAFFDGSTLTRKAVSESLELSFWVGLLASLFWALSLCLLTHLDQLWALMWALRLSPPVPTLP